MSAKRYFEVYLNDQFMFPAYTLEVTNAKEARNIAVRDAKLENNRCICIIEVDKDGNDINGYCSGRLTITKSLR